MTDCKLRLAIAGCGAATEVLHIPALKTAPSVQACVFSDLDVGRAQRCADQCGGVATTDLWNALGDFDALLVCTSPHSHYDICRRALLEGKHVLCEKPFVLSAVQARELSELAASVQRILAVCHVRRLFWNSRVIKAMFRGGLLSDVRNIVMEDGRPYSWPQKSGDIFTPDKAAGVFLANGIHCLDLLHWWCDGNMELIEHLSDAEGGAEANTQTKFLCRIGGQQLEAVLRFSTTRQLANRITISSPRGEITVPNLPEPRLLEVSLAGLHDAALCDLFPSEKADRCEWRKLTAADQILCHSAQFESFAAACLAGRPYYLPLEDVVREVELAELCARKAKPFSSPWADVPEEVGSLAATL